MISDKVKLQLLTSSIYGLLYELKKIKNNFVKEDIDWMENYLEYTLYIIKDRT